MLQQGNGWRRKECQGGAVMNWPQAQFPLRLCCSKGGGRGIRSEERKEQGGDKRKVVLVLFFISLSNPTLLLTDNKFKFPKLNLFCPWQQLVSDHPALILNLKLFHLVFLLLSCRGGEMRAAWWGPGSQPWLIQPAKLITLQKENPINDYLCLITCRLS